MGVIVITGSASGIGAATRAWLEDAGDTVIGVDLRDAEVIADLATPQGLATAIATVLQATGGPVDVMSFADFLARYRATEAALQTYVDGLPLWVNVWRGWMFVIFTAAVVFVIWKREARWLALTMVVSLFAYNVVAMRSGVGRFPSIAFVLLWSPLAFFLWRRRPHLRVHGWFDTAYSWWLTMALATLCVSLAFDTYNVAYSLIAGLP